MTSVLYVDRELLRKNSLLSGLMSAGFHVRAATRPSQAERLMKYCLYDCLLARCVKGEYTGVASLCSVARGSVNLILVLMDVADPSFEGRLLDCGVDDVVVGAETCPDLVVIRINTRLRSRPGASVRLGNVIVDFDRRTAERNGVEYQLSGILTDLLWYFICNADHVISRRELNESPIWIDSICTPAAEGGKTFDVHVGRLRKIIEDDSRGPALIQSVRGIGWKLTARPVWDQSASLLKSNLDCRAGQLLLFT